MAKSAGNVYGWVDRARRITFIQVHRCWLQPLKLDPQFLRFGSLCASRNCVATVWLPDLTWIRISFVRRGVRIEI